MQVLNTVQKAQETLGPLKNKGLTALVPTMGCLHEGHLELIKLARSQAQTVVVSIFVNPLQFGPKEDFNKYPRTLEADQEKLQSVGVDYLFHPSADDFYPPHFSHRVQVGELGTRLCGRFRPGHFDGVATVCLKLFNVCNPNLAVFGEKDYQQLQVIRNLVRDFNLPLSIAACPTIREIDGLAMSSRNRYLSPDERKTAAIIPRTLMLLQDALFSKPRIETQELISLAQKSLSGVQIQYVEITEGPELQAAPAHSLVSELLEPRFFLAATIGNTRLIDNISLKGMRS